jgi:hypothetical protein
MVYISSANANSFPYFSFVDCGKGSTELSMSVNTALISQRMDAIQAMNKGNFLTYSYVLADNPNQVTQVYNAQFQAQIHHDAGKWHEAKVRNPDSQLAYPTPIFGFKALVDRSEQQKTHLTNLDAATDVARNQITNLRSHTERLLTSELRNCESRNKQLHMQLSKLMLQIETYALQNCKASVDFTRQRQLMEKLERVSSVLTQLQKRIAELKHGSHSIVIPKNPQSSLPASTSSFTTLKDSVSSRMDAIYATVLDRCRSVSSAAVHEKLARRSNDYLSELKRQYLAAPADRPVEKQRTLTSFEIASLRALEGAVNPSTDLVALMSELNRLNACPGMLADIWTLAGYFCEGRKALLPASVEFLESKFAHEAILGTTLGGSDRVSNLADKKQLLFAYCRQRMNVRVNDNSWMWLSVYAAFRAGWTNVLREIAMDRSSHSVPGLEVVIEALVGILERNPAKCDMSRINAIPTDENGYKQLLISVCRGEYVKLAQFLPEATAYDWIWFSLREINDTCDIGGDVGDCSKYNELVGKIKKLPTDYFQAQKSRTSIAPSTSLYPSLGTEVKTTLIHHGKSIDESKGLLQLGLMHILVLQFDSATQIALKTKTEPFDINNHFHRTWLFVSLAFDKFGVLRALPGCDITRDAVGPALEAALTVADHKERDMYALGLSGDSARKFNDTLNALEKRRSHPSLQ